ncbi:MAG TPA: peptidoglycan DD-metalloendopeptidase family protein [Usitatibacter sp.]|nr:peptidoglycan DD-metalloendopeptidase family protein [Usitatibacter sp.]
MTRARLVRRGAAALLLLLPLAPVALAAPAKDAAASEARLKSLRERIEKLQADLSAAQESRGEARDRLRESDRALSEAHRALFELRQQRKDLEARLGSIEDREAKASAALERQKALAAKLLRLQYEQGATDRLRLILEGRDPQTASRHLHYYGYIQRARADLITGLRREEQELARLQEEARARRDELAANEAGQARESRRLEKERAQRAAAVAKISGEISRGRKRIGSLKRDEARLAKLVERIARELAEQSRAAGKNGEPVDRVADASLAARPFASLKGKLHLPVRGRLMNHYGDRREATGTAWKGLFIRAVTGETVRAVADGIVVYADWLRGFGNLLILDHGGGYMSLYADNEGLLRKVGEKVRAGDPVASVGASGESADSGLYFELRRDGKPFDPLKWTAR